MHQQCKDASRNPASTRSPSWTMDQNRYGFLPRCFRAEIFNRCRLFLQVPIHLPCHIDSPLKDAEIFVRSVFDQRHTSCHDDRQRTTPSTVRNSDASQENLTSSTRHPHRTSTSQMDSSRPWSRRSKLHTRRWTDLQMPKWEHYCSNMTPQSWKAYQQRFYTDGLHKELSCPDITDPSTSRKSTDDY